MTRENIISACFAALLLFILYSTLLVLSPFFHPIFWSAIIAYGCYPLYNIVLIRCKNRRDLAALVTTVAIFLIFLPIVVFCITSLAHEAVSIYEWLGLWLREGGVEKLIDRIHSMRLVQKIENSEIFQREFVQEHTKQWLAGSAEIIGRFLVKEVFLITKNALMAVIDLLLMIFLVFFFLKDGDRIYSFVHDITPLEDNIKKLVFTQLGDTFSAVLRGQLFTAIAQAGSAAIIFWLLRVPLPLFFASLTFLAALVPIVGAAAIWVPMVIYLFFIKRYVAATLLLILGSTIISLVDNLLKPLLIGKKMKLPYLLLFLGILGGMQVYGLMGIFLAPAVLSLFFVLIRVYQEKMLYN